MDERKPEEELTEKRVPSPGQISEPAGTVLNDLELRYLTLAGGLSDVIYSLSPEGIITSLNPAFEEITGMSRQEWIGKNFSQLIHPDDLPFALEKFLFVLGGNPSAKFEIRTCSSKGNYLTAEVTATPLIQAGKVVSILGIARDITEHSQVAEQLRTRSHNDELTGLYNRRGFLCMAEKFMGLAKRQKKGLLIMYMELYELKMINDTIGHAEGDQALRDIADILKRSYRQTDVVARLGGSEFAVIPIGATKDDVDLLAGNVQKNMDTYNAAPQRQYKLSLRINASYYDKEKPLFI